MGDFKPHHKPGKTSPRLIKDLVEYDARRNRQIGKSLLIDPPAIYREGGKLHPLRTLPNDCPHQLRRKDLQTVTPAVDERPSTASKYISASYCARCLWHFDVIADFTKRPGRDKPCELATLFPLHHFQYVRTKQRTQLEKEKTNEKYDNFKEIHTFACSNPACPVVVDIRISPPRLNKERLASLWDPARVFRRGQKAMEEQPERYQDMTRPLAPIEVLSVLRTYLCDALNKYPAEKKRIAVRNKKFLLAFSDECDDLFEYLEFVLHLEPSSDGEAEDKYWILPTIDLPSQGDTFAVRSKRQFIEDVVFELSERMTDSSQMEVANLPNRYVYNPLPATNDIYNTLGCLGYIKGSRAIINLEEEHEHPHYAGLGAVHDFSDALIAFAYERQRECDPQNNPYYLECLQGIGQGRESEDLQAKSVMAISMGEHTLTDIENAYKFFAINQDTTGGDDYIIGLYKSRIESAPRQKEEARQCLQIIGHARQSETIQAMANDRAMSFQEALEYLNVTEDTPPDSIEAVAITMVDDGDKAKVARALRVIGEHRNQYSMQLFATTVESGDSSGAFPIAEAYKRLQIGDPSMRDESVISYYQTLCANAPPGSKASFAEALRTIATARDSALLRGHLDDPNAPIVIEKGSEDQPVGLDNIGNTCYLNSLLQYYYTVKPVRDVVMNFKEYRMELNTENMLKKRVGGRAVSRGEIIKAQKFVEELQNLFTNLKTAPTRSVKPTQDLAELTLFSAATEANFRRASISSPAAPSLSLASYLDGPIYGPELPPPPPLRPPPIPLVKEDDIEMVDRPSHDPANQDDDSSDATLVDLDPPTPNDVALDKNAKMVESPIDLTEDSISEVINDRSEYLLVTKDADKSTAVSAMDGATQSRNLDTQGDQVMTNGPTSNSVLVNAVSAPEKPPPVPPRNKPAPIQTAAESEESLRAQKLYFGAQQDVTEVIGNVMFRLQCAIKPTSIDPKFGEQIDKIRETFYGANAVYLKKANTYDVKIEDWANIIVFPSADGPRSIYEALDVVFDEQEVEINNTFTTQYASISKLPPIFQTQIQRTAFDPKTQQASKNQNPIVFEETIYLDRYMDSEKVMQRRKDAWKWKTRIRKLEARQKVLETTPVEITVPDALDATKNYIQMLEEEDIDGILVNPTLSEALGERRAEIIRELDSIAEEIANLKKRLQDQFTDMREHRYRLQAVFIHRGTSTYGHYWIYIYDFERDIWREYNDERVTVVNDRKQIFEQTGANGPTPYYLVYVKDQLKDDLVDAVYRDIVEEEPDMPNLIMIDDSNMEMENGIQHIEDVSLIRHRLDGAGDTQSRDLAQMGSWDLKGPHANDAPW